MKSLELLMSVTFWLDAREFASCFEVPGLSLGGVGKIIFIPSKSISYMFHPVKPQTPGDLKFQSLCLLLWRNIC